MKSAREREEREGRESSRDEGKASLRGSTLGEFLTLGRSGMVTRRQRRSGLLLPSLPAK